MEMRFWQWLKHSESQVRTFSSSMESFIIIHMRFIRWWFCNLIWHPKICLNSPRVWEKLVLPWSRSYPIRIQIRYYIFLAKITNKCSTLDNRIWNKLLKIVTDIWTLRWMMEYNTENCIFLERLRPFTIAFYILIGLCCACPAIYLAT